LNEMNINNLNDLGFQPLNKSELSSCNGGAIPGANTSFANDAAYYIVYGACAFWDGIRNFGACT